MKILLVTISGFLIKGRTSDYILVLTFLDNVTGRFPTKTVLATLSGFSTASQDFLHFLLGFLTTISSSSLKEHNPDGNWY